MEKWEENIILGIFVIGTILFFWKFYESQEPNFFNIVIFLIAVLILILFQDKLAEFSIFGNGLKMKLKDSEQTAKEKNLLQKQSNLTIKEIEREDLSGAEE